MTLGAETICALATPPGHGGVAVVRVSGPLVPELAAAVVGSLPPPRQACFRRFNGAGDVPLDEGLALYFPAPHSFTGEHVLELQGHGGPVVVDRLLGRLVQLGARLARPGEFSERAFLNGKLDLAQAEAVADLIAATTEAGARAALRSLHGEFSHTVHALVESLTELRVYVESSIDFPDEEGVEFLADSALAERLAATRRRLAEVQTSARQGQLLRDGMTVVIAGRPNAGKSSLLNRLAGYEAAIVTEVAGTTRDLLRERIQIDGMPLHVIDTAGLRETVDLVEREGVRRARAALEQADRVLLVVDDRLGLQDEERAVAAELPAAIPLTVIRNKIDLSGEQPGQGEGELGPEVRLSAATGAGLAELRQQLTASMGFQPGEGEFLARRRHLQALSTAAEHLELGAGQLAVGAGELLAEELRLAQQVLGEITGQVSSDELLGRIFSSFCIGK